MSGNLSLFEAGSAHDNVSWSVIGGSWQGTYTSSLAWSTCYSSAINARTFDQFGQTYGNTTCNPVPSSPPGGGNGGEILTACDASNGCNEPLLINVGNGPYRLTGPEDPVSFDIHADGNPRSIGWTAAGEPIAFLSLDRNGNGTIDDGSELFGNAYPLTNGAPAVNGFDALSQYDVNRDGVIDADDAIWTSLLLWTDLNHNGISEPAELQRISSSEITGIDLTHHWTGRRDASGNYFGYQGHVEVGHGRRACYDVFFVSAP